MKKTTLILLFLLVFQLNFAAQAVQPAKNNMLVYQQFSYYERLYKSQPNNVNVLKEYLSFLEKNKYYLKAIELSDKLFKLTNNRDYIVKKADLLVKQGDKQNAVKIYLNEYAVNPKNNDVAVKLAHYYYDAGKFKESVTYLKQSLSHSCSNEFQLMYGKALFYTGENKEAKNALETYIKKNPNDRDALTVLSDVYLSLKDFDSAIKTLSVLNNSSISSMELKTKLGDAYFASGNSQKAGDVFETVLKSDPNNIKSINSLADISLAQKNFERATVYLEKLNDITKSSGDENAARLISNKLASAYFATKNYDKAEEIYLNLVNKYPNDNDALMNLSDVYVANKKYDKAIDILKGQVEKNQDTDGLAFKLAKVYIYSGNFAEAKKILDNLYSKNPDNLPVNECLADVDFYTNDYYEASKLYEKVYAEKNSEDITYKYAESLRLSRNFVKAEQLYKNIDSSKVYGDKSRIALAYIKLEKYRVFESRKMFEKVLKDAPDNYDAKLGLGITYASTEDNLKALEILNALPQNDDVRYEKGKTYYNMKMYADATKCLIDNKLEKAKKLYGTVQTLQRVTSQPEYNSYQQSGDENNKLQYNKYNIELSKYTAHNLKPKADFSIVPYRTSNKAAKRNAYKYSIGMEGRPVPKYAFDSEVGIIHFNDAGNMLTGKFLNEYYFNDKFKVNLGFQRENLERSMLSSAGVIPETGPFAGDLVGQIADNRVKAGYVYKMPKYFFNYGSYDLGFAKGDHVPTNIYHEGVLGLGKVIYTRPKGHLLDLAMTEVTGYYGHYKDNRLGFGGASLTADPIGSDGMSPYASGRNPGLGGYFSPKYVFSEKVALHLRGSLNILRLSYNLYNYAGMQNIAYNNSDFIWGSRAVLAYNEEGAYGLRLLYGYEDYNQAKRHNFAVNLIIRPW